MSILRSSTGKVIQILTMLVIGVGMVGMDVMRYPIFYLRVDLYSEEL